jgi:isoleucyl-tRNA synthetase
MSKSLGNVVSAVKATEQHGADVLRLMVAGMDYADDVRISERSIKEASESYRKIRNTFRYLLGNLEDYERFDPSTVDPKTLHDIDLWALGQLNQVIRDALAAYESFEFYWVVKKLNHFLSITLSSFYLDVLKDRLYAEDPTGADRRAAQFVLFKLHEVLTRLLAPILPHTAEECWGYLPHGQGFPASVHLATFPELDPRWDDPKRDARWAVLREAREAVLKALEGLRKDKTIGSAQEAAVEIVASPDDAAVLQTDRDLLATICLVSDVTIRDGGPVADGAERFQATASKSARGKCERCWNYREDVGASEAHPALCGRCVRVIESLNAKGSV